VIKSLFSYTFAKNYRKRSIFEKSYGKNKTVQFFLPHSVVIIFLCGQTAVTNIKMVHDSFIQTDIITKKTTSVTVSKEHSN